MFKLYSAITGVILFRICCCLDISFTLDVGPGVRECLHQYIVQGLRYEVEYQVIDGGDLDINFIVESPSSRIIIPDVRKTSYLHKLTAAETGDFKFCIDNSFSRISNKIVFFELFIDDQTEQNRASVVNSEDAADYEYKLDDFRGPNNDLLQQYRANDQYTFPDNVDKIYDNLHHSIQAQKLFSAIEARDRSIVEKNFERVNFWSAVQLVAMISVAAVNIFVIRSLFEPPHGKSSSSTKLST